MKTLHIGRAGSGSFLGLAYDINGPSGGIDYGSRSDANLRNDVGGADVAVGYGSGTGGSAVRRIQKSNLPERSRVRAAIRVRVEGIYAVVFGSDVYDVVCTLARNRDPGNV